MQDPSRPATGYPAPPYYQPNGGQAPPTGTAYPYNAQPPYPQPQYYNPNSSRANFTRSFFRTFLATIICLFVIFGVIVFITWLVLRPSLPHFRVESFSVANFSATSSGSSPSVSGTWQAAFLVQNNNKKMSIAYRMLQSSMFYKDVFISETLLPPFEQEKKSETTLNGTFSAVNSYVEKSTVDDLNGDKAHGSISFDVQIIASSVFRSGAWRLRTRVLKILCRNIVVGISSNSSSGSLSGGARDCLVWT